MITIDEARRLVLRHLAEIEADQQKVTVLRKDLTPKERDILGLGQPQNDVIELAILDDHTITQDFGWVFFYQSKKYLNSGDGSHALAGNAPIIVSRRDGRLHETGTAEPIEAYIENFKRTGNPHG